MQLKNTITLSFEPYALKTRIRSVDSINEKLQYCKSPLGNNRKT